MRRDALEAFCSNAHFDFYDDNLGSKLSFLRDVMPREGLSQLNRVKFMTESHCIYWAAVTQRLDYKKDWRAVVALLAERANLKHLSITVTMSNGQPICTSLGAFSIEFTHHSFVILAMYPISLFRPSQKDIQGHK